MAHRTCRICSKYDVDDALVKYGVRAYGHAKCLLGRHGVDVLDRLSLAELERFPVLALRSRVGDPVAHLSAVIEAKRARLRPPAASIPR